MPHPSIKTNPLFGSHADWGGVSSQGAARTRGGVSFQRPSELSMLEQHTDNRVHALNKYNCSFHVKAKEQIEVVLDDQGLDNIVLDQLIEDTKHFLTTLSCRPPQRDSLSSYLNIFYNKLRDKRSLTSQDKGNILKLLPALTKIEALNSKAKGKRNKNQEIYGGLKLETQATVVEDINGVFIQNTRTQRKNKTEFSHAKTLATFYAYLSGDKAGLSNKLIQSVSTQSRPKLAPQRRMNENQFLMDFVAVQSPQHGSFGLGEWGAGVVPSETTIGAAFGDGAWNTGAGSVNPLFSPQTQGFVPTSITPDSNDSSGLSGAERGNHFSNVNPRYLNSDLRGRTVALPGPPVDRDYYFEGRQGEVQGLRWDSRESTNRGTPDLVKDKLKKASNQNEIDYGTVAEDLKPIFERGTPNDNVKLIDLELFLGVVSIVKDLEKDSSTRDLREKYKKFMQELSKQYADDTRRQAFFEALQDRMSNSDDLNVVKVKLGFKSDSLIHFLIRKFNMENSRYESFTNTTHDDSSVEDLKTMEQFSEKIKQFKELKTKFQRFTGVKGISKVDLMDLDLAVEKSMRVAPFKGFIQDCYKETTKIMKDVKQKISNGSRNERYQEMREFLTEIKDYAANNLIAV